jgi:hypothetical protein
MLEILEPLEAEEHTRIGPIDGNLDFIPLAPPRPAQSPTPSGGPRMQVVLQVPDDFRREPAGLIRYLARRQSGERRRRYALRCYLLFFSAAITNCLAESISATVGASHEGSCRK